MTDQEKIQYLRIKYRLSMKKMAEESGVGYSSLRNIASGYRTGLSEENIVKLKQYLEQFTFPDKFL